MRTSDKKLHGALNRKIVEAYRKIDRKKSRIDENVDLSAAKTLKGAINTAKIITKKIESAGKFFKSDAITNSITGIKKELVEFTVQGLGKSEKQNVQIFKNVMLVSRELSEINNAIFQMVAGISDILETAEIEVESIEEKTLSSMFGAETESALKEFFENVDKLKGALVKSVKSPKKKDKNAGFFEKFFGVDKKESLDVKKMVDEVVDKAEIKNLNLWLKDADFDEMEKKIQDANEKAVEEVKKAKENEEKKSTKPTKKDLEAVLDDLVGGRDNDELAARINAALNDKVGANVFENKKQQKGDTMKLTETMLRKMIQEERSMIKSKGRKRINESLDSAAEALYDAMTEYVDVWIADADVEDPDRELRAAVDSACEALKKEVQGFCDGFSEEY